MKKSRFKKFFVLCICAMLMGSVDMSAQILLDLQVGIVDPTVVTDGHGKSPIEIPSLWQEGHDLYFLSSHDSYTLEILSGNVVVYSVAVPSTTTLVTLPTWLTGEYTIRLTGDTNYYFYGFISL